jgi:hypothetical protein
MEHPCMPFLEDGGIWANLKKEKIAGILRHNLKIRDFRPGGPRPQIRK